MKTSKFIPLKELVVYQLARQLPTIAWNIFSSLTFDQKKIIDVATFDELKQIHDSLEIKLNNFIPVTYKNAQNK